MIAAVAMMAASLVPGCYLPPVSAPIAVPYVAPACRYCPGHRGVAYQLAPGTVVAAVSAGVVTFSGLVAGTRYLVVLQPDGLRATYGMLSDSPLSSGDLVGAGASVGRSSDRLYFGLRDGLDAPLDPTPLLGRLAGRPRLVPVGGATRRAAPPPRVVCAAADPSLTAG